MSAPTKVTDLTHGLHREALIDWLANGERGISSDTLVHYLTGQTRPRSKDHPHDPGDFRRCELLLRQVPSLRIVLPRMSRVSPTWAALVDNWDRIVSLMEDEAPGCFGPEPGGEAPQAYALIHECQGQVPA